MRIKDLESCKAQSESTESRTVKNTELLTTPGTIEAICKCLDWQYVNVVNVSTGLAVNVSTICAFVSSSADCGVPEKTSWCAKLGELLHDNHDCHSKHPQNDAQQHQTYCAQTARDAHAPQLLSDVSSEATSNHSIKDNFKCERHSKQCERHIKQCDDWHLRHILAQFCAASHGLDIETGLHKRLDDDGRTCPNHTQKCVNLWPPCESI